MNKYRKQKKKNLIQNEKPNISNKYIRPKLRK